MTPVARGLLAALLAAALPAAAADVPEDKPFPIDLAVGGSVSLCKTGTLLCPATAAICDDTSVATLRAGPEGLEIVGVKKGKTLCSAGSSGGARRVYAVTVR